MKKRLILTACLAFAMGLGVAVGAHRSQVAKSEAAGTKTVYLKPGVWSADSAVFEVYSWGSATNWASMDEVATDPGVYKAEIPDGNSDLIMCRMNPAGTAHNWGSVWNQSADLSYAAATPLYEVTGWGASDGSWKAYTEPSAASVYSYSLNGAADVDMTISGSEAISASLSFKAGDELTFKKDDAALAVTAKDDGLYTKVEVVDSKLVFVQDYTGILYLDLTTNKLWAGEIDSGYYLNGSSNSWNLKHAIKAVEQTDEVTGDPNGVFEAKGIILAANAEVKFIEMIHDTKEPSYKEIDSEKLHIGKGVSASLTEGETPNLKIANAGTYDFYYNSTNGWYSVENPNYEEVYTMKIVGEEGTVTLVQNEEPGKENEYLLPADHSFSVGDKVEFFLNGDQMDVGPKEDNQLTRVMNDDEDTLVFAQAFEGKLVLDSTTGLVWAGQFAPGYYLAGVGGEWNAKLAIPAPKEAEGDAYVVENIALAANTEFKFIEAPSDDNEFYWIDADGSRLSVLGEEVGAEVLEGGNIKVARASTYDLYYDPTGGEGLGWHSIVDKTPVVHVYTVKVGATTYNTKLNTGTEWMIDAIDIPLTAGQSVAVYKDGVLDSTFARKAVGNNNLDADGKVIANSSAAQIYFDLSTGDLFVGGLGEVGGYHLLVNNNLVRMTKNDDPLDPSFREYYSELISFKDGDEVKFLDKTGDAEGGFANTFVITKFNEGCEPAGTFSTARAATDGVLEVLQDVNLKVYLKLKTGEDEIYYNTVAPEVAEARDWAKGFTDSVGGVCRWDNKTDLEDLAEAWQAKVTSYGLLDEKVQNVLKAATDKDSINELKAFVLMYDYVAGKYGDQLGEGYNFLGKTLPAPLNPAVDYTFASSDNNIMIIVIASAVALSMAMVTLIIIKKKKFSK